MMLNAHAHRFWLFASFSFLIALPLTTNATTKSSTYRAYLTECFTKHICNGTYLIAQKGKPVFAGAFGHAGDESKTSLTLESAFDIGSISKQFTAMAVLQQVTAGKISLDSKAADYLKGFPYPDVTVAQLLSHTSGIPDAMPYYSNAIRQSGAKIPITGTDIVSVLANNSMPAEYAPSTRYQYSNTGYMVLAVLVEHISGQPFDEYLMQKFFKPLGMKNTQLLTRSSESTIQSRAFGFATSPLEERRVIDQIPGFYMRGAGGIYSTAPDLLRWINALKAGRVVSRQMLKLAMTPTQLSDGSAVPYGFGLSLKPDILGAHRVSHGGHWRAFKSDASWYPDTDLTIIQLTNNNEDDSVDHNSTALALIAAGETPAPLLESIIWKLPQKLENESALQLWFLDVLTQNPQRYRIEESDLNNLGYAYLKRKEVERAIKVFKLGTLAFPKSDNAFDSLADAYEAAGDLHGAYQSMQSAITLNPTSAVYTKRAEMLKAKLQ